MEKVKEFNKGKKYIYAKGGRKTATAQCRLYKNGKGVFLVNGKPYKEYFRTAILQDIFIVLRFLLSVVCFYCLVFLLSKIILILIGNHICSSLKSFPMGSQKRG